MALSLSLSKSNYSKWTVEVTNKSGCKTFLTNKIFPHANLFSGWYCNCTGLQIVLLALEIDEGPITVSDVYVLLRQV